MTLSFIQALESAHGILCGKSLYTNEGDTKGFVIKPHGNIYLELGRFDGIHHCFTVQEIKSAHYCVKLNCWIIGGRGIAHRIELISFNRINHLPVSC